MSSSCCPKGLVGGAAARSVSASEWEQEREREREGAIRKQIHFQCGSNITRTISPRTCCAA